MTSHDCSSCTDSHSNPHIPTQLLLFHTATSSQRTSIKVEIHARKKEKEVRMNVKQGSVTEQKRKDGEVAAEAD